MTDPDQDKPTSPIRATDAEAINLARELIADARHGVVAVMEPGTGYPLASRVALGQDSDGRPMTLISELSHHTQALKQNGRCSLLVGEVAGKGDPLTHPRITLQADARFVRKGEPGHDALRALYLAQNPKSKLYIDFGDFSFAIFDIKVAYLNGGFGKAYNLTPTDLGLPDN